MLLGTCQSSSSSSSHFSPLYSSLSYFSSSYSFSYSPSPPHHLTPLLLLLPLFILFLLPLLLPPPPKTFIGEYLLLLFLLPLALQPIVGFGLSNNVLPFFPIGHQLSPSSHSQHLKISFYFLFPSFPGSSPSSRPFQFLSEDLFGHPILLNSL